MIKRNEAFELLKKYNKDPFHIQHSLTVEAVMKWYAKELGYGDDAEYWRIVGLLHDIDFELYPEEHCLKASELLREGGVSEDIIHAAGCSREVIERGAEQLGWELDKLLEMTLKAMAESEDLINEEMAAVA